MNDLAEDAEMIRYAADTTADKRILLKHAPTTRGGGGDPNISGQNKRRIFHFFKGVLLTLVGKCSPAG